MLLLARSQPRVLNKVMLFLTSYIFLLRLPSEALPIVKGAVGVDSGEQASLVVQVDTVVLKLARRKNKLQGSSLLRKCWCAKCEFTCPVHVLGPYVEQFVVGEKLFGDTTAATALLALREILHVLAAPESNLYGTHDLRRGHARDLQAGGASLREILDAGEWRSPAFLSYLDYEQLDADAVVEAHMDESEDEDC